MIFTVNIPEIKRDFSPDEIEELTFTSNIFDLYARCNLIVKDIASETFNQIKTGMDIDVIFSEGSLYYKNRMKVLSFDKTPGKQYSLSDNIKLQLISSFYFVSSVLTTAYQGNVGAIISSISNKYFNKHYTADFSATDDVTRVRYQTGEKCQDFMSRILKYGIASNLPVYLYMNPKNTLELKGVAEMIKRDPSQTLYPDLVETTSDLPTDDRNASTHRILNYRFASNNEGLSSETTTKFTTNAFTSSRTLKSYVTLKNTEINNVQSDTVTPEKVKFKLWNLTPDDALTISVKENFEVNVSAYYLSCLCNDLLVEDVYPGQTVKILFPENSVMNTSTGSRANLGEGIYLVQKAEYIWQGGNFYTRLNLLQARY